MMPAATVIGLRPSHGCCPSGRLHKKVVSINALSSDMTPAHLQILSQLSPQAESCQHCMAAIGNGAVCAS